MNAHLKKVEINIPRGQFLPKPPILAPVLKPIMTDYQKLELEKDERRKQQLFREMVGNPHLFAEDINNMRKMSVSARKVVEETKVPEK